MEALKPDEFLQQLSRHSRGVLGKDECRAKELRRGEAVDAGDRAAAFAVWRGHGAQSRRSDRAVGEQDPDLDLQQPMSEYVVNELKHTSILRKRISDLNGDPDGLWNSPSGRVKGAVGFSCRLGFVCELIASRAVRPRRVFSADVEVIYRAGRAIDPTTAAIYRDTLLADEAGHEWIAPEILKRYATDAESQEKCLAALKSGCELFGRAIQSFNQSMPA